MKDSPFEAAFRQVETSAIHGVEVELRHFLPADWPMTVENEVFVVRPNPVEDWEDTMWKVIRSVCYRDFHALCRTASGNRTLCYDLVSARADGGGFHLRFVLPGG